MKRICFFSGNMSRGGGTERMTQLLANRLCVEEEYDVYVLSKSDNNKPTFFPLDETISYLALDNGSYKGPITLIKDIILLSKYINKNKIDILVNVDVSLGIFSLPLKLLCPKLKLVFWEHFCVLYNIGNKKTNKLRKAALKHGDAYITLTPDDALELKSANKKACRILNIPNICEYAQSEEAYNTSSKTILSAGNLITAKGFDMALETAAIVFKRYPDWTWEIYGDGSQKENLLKQAYELGIENNIRFMGRVKDLRPAYENASFFVLTSRSEGFGLVLIEAQSYNLPTIAFNVPFGPKNIITDGVNGKLVEPFNINSLADSICELIEEKNLRKVFSENASKNLWRYSADEIVKHWKILLGEL